MSDPDEDSSLVSDLEILEDMLEYYELSPEDSIADLIEAICALESKSEGHA